jgi:transcriptional regulator with XRE-family HTH domain
MAETFGEFLRDQRLKAGFGLRAFAAVVGLQASNLSSVEHGRIAPPQDRGKLDELADVLNLPKGSAERMRLYDLAAAGHQRLPADVAAFAAKTPGIPVLLRTIEKRGLKKAELEQLTQYVNRRRRKT